MEYLFRNLALEGGGVKGIAYLGAFEVLEAQGVLPQIQRISGTSAGAINAILLGLNFSVKDMRDILWAMDFKQFLDDSWGYVADVKRLLTEYGWYKGDFFRDWMGELIKQKTGNSNATFADVESMKSKKGFKSIYITGTNLSTSFSEVFSAEHTPRMCIADAANISMSIPLFFAAKKSLRGDVYVDGGVLKNYPVKVFDRIKYLHGQNFVETAYYEKINKKLNGMERPVSRYVYNKETLGFRLATRDQIALFRDHAEPQRTSINNFLEYTIALISTMIESQQSAHLHSDDWARTVFIDTLGVKEIDFGIKDSKKSQLVESGKAGALHYINWYDNHEIKPNK